MSQKSESKAMVKRLQVVFKLLSEAENNSQADKPNVPDNTRNAESSRSS